MRLDPWKDRLLPVGPCQLPRDIPLHPSRGTCEEDTYDLPCFQMKKLMLREMKESASDLGGGNGICTCVLSSPQTCLSPPLPGCSLPEPSREKAPPLPLRLCSPNI